MDEVERRLHDAAAALDVRARTSDIQVLVDTRWQGPFRAQGLCAYELGTDVFEPVRRRWPWARRWELRQSPEQAAVHLEWFLTHRPDLSQAQRAPHDEVVEVPPRASREGGERPGSTR